MTAQPTPVAIVLKRPPQVWAIGFEWLLPLGISPPCRTESPYAPLGNSRAVAGRTTDPLFLSRSAAWL